MDRRELLKMIALATGGTIIGGEFLLSGCKSGSSGVTSLASVDVALLDEIAETILPKTNTPGGKDAEVGKFMKLMVTDCYEEKDQKIFVEGLDKLDEACNKMHSTSFIKATPRQRNDLLLSIDKEAKEYNKTKKPDDPNHYFTMIKQLTLLGFFTSKPGATQALRYIAVPGRYDGCVPYTKGEKAWAT
ncbi:MAG: gluconate 2-dehydrogenase subunit 3 family protein [Sphingobacteriales bacterium]|nr:gluconate 2-dehydrogenase subunit 3 family protein [Sphingobacteriales bacterium]